MKLVIPLAGKDTRYEDAFGTMKPLVEVGGKPLLAYGLTNLISNFTFRCKGGRSAALTDHHLYCRGEATPRPYISEIIFICLAEEIKKYNLNTRLKEIAAPICQNIRIVAIPELTEGATCSVLKAAEFIDSEEEVLIYLADILLRCDLKKAILERDKDVRGVIPVFSSQSEKYSYAVTEDGYVSRVAEKKVISKNATAGIYFFASGKEFTATAKRFVKNETNRVRNLFFLAPVFNELIKDGKKVKIEAGEFKFGLGSPEEVKSFMYSVGARRRLAPTI